MIIKNVKKHGTENITYTGEIADHRIIIVFEDGATPVEGDIKVVLGKMVTKNNQNYYYIRGYEKI